MGSNAKVDVRIIAATNRNLEESIESGLFREDPFYGLNVIPLFLPPLRDRSDDIPVLADHFPAEFSRGESHALRGAEGHGSLGWK